MAKIVFGLNQSLDGYVDHQKFAPGPLLFRHFVEHVRGTDRHCLRSRHVRGNCVIGTKTFLNWDTEERDFAVAWAKPAEVGRVALAQVSWPKRHTYRG